jgi:hypothetical protein
MRLEGYPVLAAVRTGIPEGSKPLAGGKRSATSGGCCRKRRKRGFHDGAEPLKTFDFGIDPAVNDGKNQAFRHPTARGLSLVSRLASLGLSAHPPEISKKR